MIRAKAWLALAASVMATVLAGCGGAEAQENSVERKGERGVVAKAMPAAVSAPREVRLLWPTPNDAYLRGAGVERFIQPTVSGEVLSGLFGSVRSGGRQFHEGVDLFPLTRDRKGEPDDKVMAAMAGVVRHVSAREGASNYGRYVVLEHPDQSPAVYTLYAHLAKIEPGLSPGQRVEAGATLGMMGRSAGAAPLPKERAHLHFEIGVRVTDRFQEWYRSRGFGSPNEHGLWNGMNLMGLDPLEFFARSRAGGLKSLDAVFAATPVAARVRVARAEEPDYAWRYPSLVEASDAGQGWGVDVSATGVPLRLRRIRGADLAGMRVGEIRVMEADAALLAANRGRRLVKTVRGKLAPDEDLITVIEQLWGAPR